MAEGKTMVQLEVDGKTRSVSSFAMAFNQPIDKYGQVAGVPRGGQITMRLKASQDRSPELYVWMIQQDSYKNGKIRFYTTANKWSEIIFNDAICVNYLEFWEDQANVAEANRKANEPIAHWEEITITCREIRSTVCSNVFTNSWELEGNIPKSEVPKKEDKNPYDEL